MITATLPPFAAEWVEWLTATFPAADALACATAGLVAVRAEEGHVCVDLAQEVGSRWNGFSWPDLAEWRARLLASGFVAEQNAHAPLVLDGSLLYLARLWNDEVSLAQLVSTRADLTQHDPAHVRAVLATLFGKTLTDRDQLRAIATALLNRFTLIAGGPGTGKTTTVAQVLTALVALQADCRIVLAAPTGKAAARMAQALNSAKQRLGLDMLTMAALPSEAQTLHRLLGYRPDSATPRHGPEHPLPLDILVVDEASMIDLALFTRLLAALPSHASVIFLGDDAQLASVESGRVFADLASLGGLSEAGAARLTIATGHKVLPQVGASLVGDGIARLSTSHRFAAGSGIALLADRARTGNSEGVTAMADQHYADLAWHPGALRTCLREFVTQMAHALTEYKSAVAATDITRAWAAFQRLCVLSPLRDGPAGVEQLNRLVETQVFAQEPRRRPFYAGRPIIVRANAPTLGLANGDIGITLATPDGLKVYFPTQEGWSAFAPSRLPRHDTAFVLTVHQAQGSEFDEVWLMLPDEDMPVLDRSLIYTAVTRARKRVVIWGSRFTLGAAVARHTQRSSGLINRLALAAVDTPTS